MKIPLLSLLMCLVVCGQAQQFLYLKRNNEFPDHRFVLHEKVNFRTGETDEWATGKLEEIRQESVKISGVVYPLKDITAFRTRNALLDLFGSALWSGGLLFTGIAFFNRTINGDKPLLTNGQIIFGSSLIVSGLVVNWLNLKTYKKEEGYNWVVIDINEYQQAE